MAQLCETCDIEVFKKCEWPHGMKPVEGWKAKKVNLENSEGKIYETYIIEECPNYVKEAERPKRVERVYQEVFVPKKYCVYCHKLLEGKQKKYCSHECMLAEGRKQRRYTLWYWRQTLEACSCSSRSDLNVAG